MPHGFDLNDEDDRLLRGPVPDNALRWAEAAIGPGSRVRISGPLAGGTSSAVHALTIEDASGRAHELVLRRFVRLDWLAEEPDLAKREATALRLMSSSPVPTPQLVAASDDAVLMTRLPGEIDWDPPLRRLAELLPLIHATPVPAGTALPDYRPYRIRMRRPPVWAQHPDAWLRGIELLDGPPPSDERLFIHRDFHPGNVLWQDGEVTGLIDWVNASIGSPWADVGHCRVNLASEIGQEGADRFLELYREASGRQDEYHPYWDVSAAIGGLDEDADNAPSQADEQFLQSAISNLQSKRA
jgi:aminoglycoside phosphotransferase (APT) family kinase protein